ncbi:MAG: hypothetical protein H0V56_00820, partial [Chthoniobacterales bacterium]|nr:hypothetical protein [Chthoniobacterales bacterium]
KPTPAREAFQKVERAGAVDDKALARFFTDTAARVAAPGPVRASDVDTIDPKSPGALSLLLYGLKNWQLSQFAEAAAFLEQFVVSETAGEFAWINQYKPIARRYLDDYRVFTEAKQLPPRFTTAAEIAAATEKLRELQGQLKTRGALANELNNNLKRLAVETKRLDQTAEAERQKLLAEQSPQWEAALAKARAAAATYDFTAAYDAVTATQVTEPSLVEARENERQRYTVLRDWKSRLILDLRSGRYQGAIKVGGVAYQGVISATDSEIALRIPGSRGSAPFAWTRLPAGSLLAMSAAFAAPSAPDAGDRLWQSAVFAHSTGQNEAAEKFADAAVKAKPELKEQRELISSP